MSSQPRPTRRRAVTRTIVFLLLGAVINVAVAWAFAFWKPIVSVPSAGENYRVTPDEAALWMKWAAVSSTSHPLTCSRVSTWPLTARYVAAGRADKTINVTTDESGRVVAVSADPSSDRNYFDFALFISCGWPLRALEGARFIESGGQRNQFRLAASMTISPLSGSATLIHAIEADRPSGTAREFRILPTRIIPIGFAINTIFYAVVLWMLFALPFALRRHRRIKRGLCPKCAYDLRGSASQTCPECGTAVKA